jgi:hypothetical protein
MNQLNTLLLMTSKFYSTYFFIYSGFTTSCQPQRIRCLQTDYVLLITEVNQQERWRKQSRFVSRRVIFSLLSRRGSKGQSEKLGKNHIPQLDGEQRMRYERKTPQSEVACSNLSWTAGVTSKLCGGVSPHGVTRNPGVQRSEDKGFTRKFHYITNMTVNFT